jgi:hypothetical protein
MPTIQQERGQRTIKGLPPRWGQRAYQQLNEARAGQVLGDMPPRYTRLSAILDEVTSAPLPIDATDAQLVVLAERSANECASMTALIHDPKALRARLAWMVVNRGLEPPAIEDDRQFMLRCVDPAWWRRRLRTVHGRAFEHAAMRLGFVSIRNGAYASNETVARHGGAKRRNAKTLANVTMTNEHGHEFALAELALKSVANKSIRRAELMLRMRGCEEIAGELGHVGVFVTLTCPSKFHAVLAKSGTQNPNYNDSDAREAQGYLVKVWACIRAALHRYDIRPYGFRIAEPHHDGCPHWHMLLFVAPHQARRLQMVMRSYALAEDGDEPGAQKNRIKIVRIEAEKGTAAGYIAKYVGKNIDGEHVGVTLDKDGNEIPADMVGDEIVKPAQRVEAWASAWGIRQFQPIGQPPVTIWRELRRVAADQVADAPAHVREAWEACQRVEVTDAETGEVTTDSTASYARYIRAQGGVNQGRNYAIGIKLDVAEREGRYGLTMRGVPTGVYCRLAPETLYASTRYEWKRSIGAAAQAAPWTRVNNCTDDSTEKTPTWMLYAARPAPMAPHDDSEWYANFNFEYFDSDEYKKHCGDGAR